MQDQSSHCPYLQWLHILTPDKVLLRSNKAHFTFLILLPTALVLARRPGLFWPPEHARELLPQDFCTSFSCIKLFYSVHLMVCLSLLFHLLGNVFSSHITLTGPLIFSGLFKVTFWVLTLIHFIYTLIYSPSILHFKGERNKLPYFSVFVFFLAFFFTMCTEYFPCLFVSYWNKSLC